MQIKNIIKKVIWLPIKFAKGIKANGLRETLKRVKKFIKKDILKIKPKKRTYQDYLKDRDFEISILKKENQKSSLNNLCIFIFNDKKESRINLESQILQNFDTYEVNSIEEANNILEQIKHKYISIIPKSHEIFEDFTCQVNNYFSKNSDSSLLYFDEEFNSDNTKLPFFKPDFSIYTFTSANYFGYPVFDREKISNLGKFNTTYNLENSIYETCLKFFEKKYKISHLSKIIYRNKSKSIPGYTNYSEDLIKERKEILEKFIKENNLGEKVENGIWKGSFRLISNLKTKPKISIIIPTKNNFEVLDKCIKSIENSTYKNLEIIIINNNSDDEKTINYLKNTEHFVLNLPIPFNFAKLNNEGVKKSRGEYVIFMNNDMEVITPDWVETMLEFCQKEEVGMVGPKLLYEDNTVQHAGLILGIHGIAAHGMKYLPDNDNGYFGQANIIREVSALTGANIMMKKEIFNEMGGFDEGYAIAFNDLDLCMKVKEKGYKIIYTPFTKIYHFESKTRGKIPHPIEYQEGANFIHKWGRIVHAGDPFYNPNLTLESEDFSIR